MEICSVKHVDDLVAFHAVVRPNAVALSYQSVPLTYKELNDRADVLAQALRGWGVGPESVVGICARRSPAMVVGALAILKAGGAYLPLDPLNPATRLAFMAVDAQIAVLVTGPGGENKIPKDSRPRITMDEFGRIVDAPTPPGAKVAPLEALPKTLAYVIFTSGSTGDPNGVEVKHENLLNLVSWHQEAFHVQLEDRASQIASVGFDAAGWEIWPYLAAGASVHIPDEPVVADPEALRDWLVAEGITISFVPTPMAELLLSVKWPARAPLRLLLTGADALHRYPPEGLPFQLINNYGPTECTVVATSGTVPPNDSQHGLPSIGLPITNTRIHILDESNQEVPVGVEGELYIGGAGVARGYRNRPELTARRFVPDPFSAKPGARLFKTGDVAKRQVDGQIAFVRRMDDQIKVRGFRIEPNEITAVLDRHPRILQSVVVPRELGSGEKGLAAYFVSRPEGPPALGELRDFLRVCLPDYMVPETFVELESLPLSANGKINRSKLPAPNQANVLQDAAFTAPRTDLEKAVAEILGSLLGKEQVDVEANFFELGGHSLLGAQLLARIRRAYGVELGLRVLFEAPTVAELSVEIEKLLALKLEKINDKPAQPVLQ